MSNPPHGAVDARRAGPVLGLAAPDLVLKANYAVPEIWLAAEAGPAAKTAEVLHTAGLHVALIPGDELRDLVRPQAVESFALPESGITLTHAGGVTELGWAESLVGVFCKPRVGDDDRSTETKGRLSGALTMDSPLESFLDIYRGGDGSPLTRFRFHAHKTDFAGLGSQVGPSQSGNLVKLTAELERRFASTTVDKRLMNIRVRQTGVTPTTDAGRRRGLSYGTQALADLLGALSPSLNKLGDADLSATLAYLTAIRKRTTA